MAPKTYTPIVSDVRMSDLGYWVVTVSVSPWQRMSVMMCQVGISPKDAADACIGMVSSALPEMEAPIA